MHGTSFTKPIKVRIDPGCDICRSSLRKIIRDKLAFLVITPDFNACGKVTHHHSEAIELTDEAIEETERRRQ